MYVIVDLIEDEGKYEFSIGRYLTWKQW